MKENKSSIAYKLKKSEKYQCKGKCSEQPLNNLWSETLIWDPEEDFVYKVIHEVKD